MPQIIIGIIGIIVLAIGASILMCEFGKVTEKVGKVIEKTIEEERGIIAEGKPVFILLAVAVILGVLAYGYKTFKG